MDNEACYVRCSIHVYIFGIMCHNKTQFVGGFNCEIM